MGRAPCCDKTQVKRGPWSPEEDDALKRYMKAHGSSSNWIALPQKAGLKRCGKSCRLRWLNYLRPDIKHGGFTPEEDNIICTLYSQMGSRWSIIASQLPGRTDNDVKNHWNTKLKKKLMAAANRINTITSHATVMPATCTTDHHHHQLSPVPYKSRGCNSTGDEIETIDNILSYFAPPDHHQSQNYQPLSAVFSDLLPSSYGLKSSSTQKLMTNPDPPPALVAQLSGPDQGPSRHGYGNGEIVDQEAEILAEFGFEMVSYDENVVGQIIHESSPDMVSISTTSQVVASPTSVANLYY